jgi:hypothetical protein
MTKEELRQFGQEILKTRNPSKHLSAVVSRLLKPSDAVVEEAARALCSHIDVAVGHSIIHALAAHAARSGCRYASVQLQADGLPTRHRPPPGVPDFGSLLNRLLWWVARRVLDRIMTPRVNEIRTRVGVGQVRSFLLEASHSAELNLIAASPSLVLPRPDWPAMHEVCGYFDLPAGPEGLPASLEAFLGAGPPPHT